MSITVTEVERKTKPSLKAFQTGPDNLFEVLSLLMGEAMTVEVVYPKGTDRANVKPNQHISMQTPYGLVEFEPGEWIIYGLNDRSKKTISSIPDAEFRQTYKFVYNPNGEAFE